MAKVTVISTGGTIASRREGERGHVSAVPGEDLLTRLRSGDTLPASIEVDDFCIRASFAFDLDLAFELARRIAHHLARNDCDGVVVTHGTDTMEESAFLADIIVPGDKPMVFTGAQRPADDPDPDGPGNIANAVRVASSPSSRGLGALILFEQQFHAARDATKTHTSRVDTFRSAEHGLIGEVDGHDVIVHRRPVLRRTYAPARIETAVDLIKLVMGADDRFLRYAVAQGARAVVLEAFGRGNATPQIVDAVKDAVDLDVHVVITSRCPQGRVRPVYGNGGGKDLADAGAIFAGDLTGPKARILLAVLLGLDLPGEGIRREVGLLCG